MHALSSLIHRNQTLQIFIIVAISVLITYAYATGRTNRLVMLGAALLFLGLVWDLRLVLPVLIVMIPFGPSFERSFGNLYLATPIVIIAAAAWFCRNLLDRRPFTFPANPILSALVILLVVLTLSAFQNLGQLLEEREKLLRFIQFFFYSSIFAMVLQMDIPKRYARALLILAVVTGVAQGMYGVWQWISNPGYYVTGTFTGDHNSFAVYVIFISLLVLGILFEVRMRVALVLLAALWIMPVSVIFSFSRAGYLAVGVAILTLLCMPVSRGRKVLLMGGCLALLIVSYYMVPEDVRLRAYSIFTNLSGRVVGISYGGRLAMWSTAFKDFLAHPLLGQGAWSYNLRDNFFIRVLGESGILGFMAFVWVLYCILRQEWLALKARVDDSFVRGFAIGLIPATVACLIVFNLSADLFNIHKFMGSFWIVLALTLKYCLEPTSNHAAS
jgi:O-antigen ligase